MRTARALSIALALTPLSAFAQPAEPPALEGPKVQERAARTTLIERDFAGKLKRLEVAPEEAALALITLDEAAQTKINAILAQRAAIMDGIVLNNLDLVVQIYNARQAGDKRAQLELLGKFMTALKPLTSRGPLADELAPAIPKTQLPAFKTLVRDYRLAAAADTQAEAKAKGERLNQRQITARENLIGLGVEVKRAYERQVTSKAAEFEAIIAQLNLSPEQETKVRNLVSDFFQKTKGKASSEEKRALFFRIMGHLDSEQQKTMTRLYMGRPDQGL